VAGLLGAAVWLGPSALGLNRPVHSGEVRFGATVTGDVCDVGIAAEELPNGSTPVWSAVFSPSVAAGRELHIELAKDGTLVNVLPHTFTTERETGCLGTNLPLGPLYTGMYRLRILDGTTVVAAGSLIIR
jgi:hypothetical protein